MTKELTCIICPAGCGLIETKEEILETLSAGASAISTGKKEFWSI